MTLKEPGDDALLNYVYNKQQEALCAIVDEINGIQTSMEEKENLTSYLLTSHFFSISFLVLASSIYLYLYRESKPLHKIRMYIILSSKSI